MPVGAVIVENNEVIATGYNGNMSDNITNHAEIIAINKAIKEKGDWRLNTCDMYITMEPCPMCAGAILNARISKVFYGAKDKTADDGILEHIATSNRLNHKCEFEQMTEYEKECAALLTNFFKQKRRSTK